MPLDFPNSPTLNQSYTTGGLSWSWDGVKWLNTPQAGADTPAMRNIGRNLIHNPLFNVAQRGAGAFNAQGLTLDRWALSFNLDVATINQSAIGDTGRGQVGDEAAEFVLFTGFTGNAGAAAYSRVLQRIENVRRLGGKTVTVSFWAATSGATLNLGVGIVQNFGTGGSPSAGVTVAGQLASGITTAYTRRSVTLSVPSVIGKTTGTNNDSNTELSFWFSSGTTQATASGNPGVQSGGIALWGMQLEIGSVATPLEKPDPRYDLANCQRFYQQAFATVRANASIASQSIASPMYWTQMRTTPVAVLAAAGTRSNVTSISVTPGTVGGLLACASVAAGDAYIISDIWNLSADL